MSEGSKKMWGGSGLFCVIVLIHLLSGRYLKIQNPMVAIIVTQGLIVLPAIIYMVIVGKNPLKFMRFRKFHLGSAFLIPVFMFCILPFMSLLNAISLLFSTELISGSIDDITGGNVFIGLALVAMLPAFVEETTFRGAIYHSLRGQRPVRAIILSGLIFGAMHMNFNQFVYAAALGIVMGFLLEATGSIVATMILHFCFNGNSVILMCLMPLLQDMLEKISPEQAAQVATEASDITKLQMLSTIVILIPFALGGAVLGFGVFYLIAKLNKRWEYIKFLFAKSTKPQRDAFEKPRMVNVLTIVGFVACFAMCILNELAAHGLLGG